MTSLKQDLRAAENAGIMFIPPREYSLWSAWLLGTDPKQRVRVEHSLTAALVYVVCVGLMVYACWAGYMQVRQAVVLSGAILLNVLTFYVLLRTGWSQRLDEPALALPQILSALTWIMGAYAISGPVHGSTMMLMTLVLMFGTFTLDARSARIASVYTVVLMGATSVVKMWTDPQQYPIKLEAAHLVLALTVMPTVSKLAAQLSAMRNKVRAQRNELSQAVERIQELATRDELTKLYNRRHMNEIIDQHQKRLERSGHHRFCLAIIDLDYFKRVNDTYGHAGGRRSLVPLLAGRARGAAPDRRAGPLGRRRVSGAAHRHHARASLARHGAAARAAGGLSRADARPDGAHHLLGRPGRVSRGRESGRVHRARRSGAVPRQAGGP